MTKVEQQTDQICRALEYVDRAELGATLMLYVTDMTFEREAICRAETILKRKLDAVGHIGRD